MKRDDDCIVLSDTGVSLRAAIHSAPDEQAKTKLLTDAVNILIQIHCAGLVHDRPHIKDMTIDKHDQISFLGLEEDPLKIMHNMMNKQTIYGYFYPQVLSFLMIKLISYHNCFQYSSSKIMAPLILLSEN